MKTEAEKQLTGLCTVIPKSRETAGGFPVCTSGCPVDYPCLCIRRRSRSSYSFPSGEEYRILLPYEAEIRTGDEILCGDMTLTVSAVNNHNTRRMLTVVWCGEKQRREE